MPCWAAYPPPTTHSGRTDRWSSDASIFCKVVVGQQPDHGLGVDDLATAHQLESFPQWQPHQLEVFFFVCRDSAHPQTKAEEHVEQLSAEPGRGVEARQGLQPLDGVAGLLFELAAGARDRLLARVDDASW